MNARIFDRLVKRVITRGTVDITYHDGRTAHFGTPAAGFPDIAVRFTDSRAPRDILMEPRLGLAEAFMDERFVIERGDIMELVQLFRANHPWDRQGSLPKPRLVKRAKNVITFAAQSFNRARGAKSNVAHHYDIGNDLYRLMLDSDNMQYSCAYWPREGMTLEQAQQAKLGHIAAKLALEPGQRVLDIGCGWGGMAIFLARRFDVEVLGITLSEEQLSLARERAEAAGVAGRVRFELIDYRELSGRFDRIVSVGMFEHVGAPQFPAFFRCSANLLEDDGVMLLHTIGRMGKPGMTDAFTRKYIFPGGYIPALSETLRASERFKLIASDIETLRLHYARTLREWYKRCLANKDRIVEMYDARFFRMWTLYLAGATGAFESGGMCNYQIQFIRNRHALPITRDYIAEAETDLETCTPGAVYAIGGVGRDNPAQT